MTATGLVASLLGGVGKLIGPLVRWAGGAFALWGARRSGAKAERERREEKEREARDEFREDVREARDDVRELDAGGRLDRLRRNKRRRAE